MSDGYRNDFHSRGTLRAGEYGPVNWPITALVLILRYNHLPNKWVRDNDVYYINVNGIASGNKLIKTIRYPSYVKISMISVISRLSLKLYLNSLVYHQNIFGSPRKVSGNLRTSSGIFGNSGKCSGTFVWPSEQLWRIFVNLRKEIGNLRKIIKTPLSVCLYNKKSITR